jgi:hypothetical protein
VQSPPGFDAGQGGYRYLLAAGTAHYRYMPEENLPQVAGDLEWIVALFTGQLGYERVEGVGLGLDPTAEELRRGLRGFFCHPDRRQPISSSSTTPGTARCWVRASMSCCQPTPTRIGPLSSTPPSWLG